MSRRRMWGSRRPVEKFRDRRKPRPTNPYNAPNAKYFRAGSDAATSANEVPKRLHFIWLGSHDLPEYALPAMTRWGEIFPTWEIKLWTDTNRPTLQNEALFTASANLGEASDILRYELVENLGGVYLDLDILPVASFEAATNSVGGWLGFGKRRDGEEGNYAENAAIGSRQGHPFWAQVVSALPAWAAAHADQGTLTKTGPRFLEQQAAQWFGSGYQLLTTGFTESLTFGDVRALGFESFYLTHNEAMTTTQALEYATNNPTKVFGIHECAGQWWRLGGAQ